MTAKLKNTLWLIGLATLVVPLGAPCRPENRCFKNCN